MRSSSATPTLRNQEKVSVNLRQKLSEFFKPADNSGGYDLAMVENFRVKIHPLNTGLNKEWETPPILQYNSKGECNLVLILHPYMHV